MIGFLLASLLGTSLLVDANLPAGNVVVVGVSNDTVRLNRELRDTADDWFYWAFRVSGAKGRTLSFKFDPSVAAGGPVGVRGPAVTTDRGKTWRFPCDRQSTRDTFRYSFDSDDEVWFYETWQYLPPEWDAFLAAHADKRGKSFETGVLCHSRQGRPVPNARFGRLDGRQKCRIFVSSRHHCSEATATPVLEGLASAFLADDELGRWLCENVELMMVPFVDYDGVIAGDQGKNRRPHDHNRDYTEFLYPETRAIRDWIIGHAGGRLDVFLDVHSPWIRGKSNEFLYTPWKNPKALPDVAAEARFSRLLEELQCGSMRYRASDDLRFGEGWNTDRNYSLGQSAVRWAMAEVKGLSVVRSLEVPFANANGAVVTPEACRALGRDLAKVLRAFFVEREEKPCVDGVYPHLAMANGEGECGTGAVVPWAGSLWAVTYGPHCPVGSSDRLYQILPDLTRVVRAESVGGTPADRLIHRETNQLLIGPYVIDAQGDVRVVPPSAMPGRLTAAARHLTDPSNKVYVATMETGLYELDMKTLGVRTLIRENGKNDGDIARLMKASGSWPEGWTNAPVTRVPGYHAKGLCSGFGRVFVANNGEDSEAARRDPFVPSGVLADWSAFGQDWSMIRRCQFTDVVTRDGIFGNEHPASNPVWSLGWDAKSVILAVTTNGSEWTQYRLPKASHCYDGAHGWNTEWPRIREAGLGDGALLATMHGTFWRFPSGFSPATPEGIRPISTYLRVIGDFCYWPEAPGGGSIVFGCDDHAHCEFLGKRKLKAGQPQNFVSTSNLWFVRPEELSSFGPPTGEGWVWCDEDVRAGDVSDPYLWEGYAERTFTFVDRQGHAVPYELLHEGDWVRVKTLADAKGVRAHFVYAPPAPATLPALNAARPLIEVKDDNGRIFRFPNVNGDTRVLCREVATERDLLYVGGVFYEVPAENAGGFACLRPIALADGLVDTIAVDRGLVVVNGRRMALDSLWKNGTAAVAYALWRKHFRQVEQPKPEPKAESKPESKLDPLALLEVLPLAIEAVQIAARAEERESRHVAELRKQGVVEVPPSEGQRHRLGVDALSGLAFDDWGEIYIDRRFVTDEELETIKAIERWAAKWFPGLVRQRKAPRKTAGSGGLPVFRGFEDARYQEHDALIVRLTAEFNANKSAGCGGTAEQAAKIPDLAPALVKSHMIEESGGNGPRSLAAWAVDPLQVNVPGDWGDEKELVGLVKPSRRNEGTVEQNVRAAIRYLSRKGFSTAARPAAERPKGYFDGWQQALRRYNGRRDRTDTDRFYSDEYAEKILHRASNPDDFVPIEIKLAKASK